ncbi:Tol-Pal system beta propeller repeat protein TolB [Roseinatronobacter bogoriensis]|uniref:Tol-Pal system protein TolB n=1 Tax=Roseinatronobacter bogoriensis subsp. barguzinensis TaxID=441209 RepID=A0A2K8KAI7_9RHOB|nr:MULTISPECIES: Tol-Pal system beta propeller repeat protein TolB [Rhodobaca]ATX66462.1 Tol-Pal system beta propeller repeat protein TolB [Rhodobaca barguzinensis]MBB4207609.1 TolB protein [Rhodobaca bogoriensis DSM 18756]TDW40084.1 TolB protein [Rhodobaca barguzinensis]TDY70763.1 TolB protein [Rhodobaca bogoriensis DSM 18756]
MTRLFHVLPALFLVWFAAFAATLPAQAQPLRLQITEGVIEPMPFAMPAFVPENSAGNQYSEALARVVSANLTNTGLFREIPRSAHLGRISSFDASVNYSDWRAINTQALITGAVSVSGNRMNVKFRLFDVLSGQQIGEGLQFGGSTDNWRRMAHKVSDAVYSRITGEGGYFDSRVVFISESGSRGNRTKRLAIMDQDGENMQYLTDGRALVLGPRMSASGDRIIYTTYETGSPRIALMNTQTGQRQLVGDIPGAMTFSPRFSPDGRSLVFSAARGGNTDLYRMDISSGQIQQLTSSPSIATAPSFSPDGRFITFESDRSGTSQIYVMPANGGEARRISFGQGRYSTPVWSPRGDLIAFTKSNAGRFHIGVMRTDGSEERLLTASFLDEGPTWSPNGRVVKFTREAQGGDPALFSVDITGRNLRRVPTPGPASDPAWGPLLP